MEDVEDVVIVIEEEEEVEQVKEKDLKKRKIVRDCDDDDDDGDGDVEEKDVSSGMKNDRFFGLPQNKIRNGMHYPSEESFTIPLFDLIYPEGLTSAWIISFQIDVQFLFQEVPCLKNVKSLLIITEREQDQVQEYRQYHPMAQVFNPKVESFGSNHAKAFILFYGTRGIRVIIHTANILFEDVYMRSEGIWWQDFPLKSSEFAYNHDQENDFEKQLLQFFSSMGEEMKKRCEATLPLYDFSFADGFVVSSIPGLRKSFSEISKYGQGRITSLLRTESQKDETNFERMQTEKWPLVIQCTSLGSQKMKTNQNWIGEELAASFLSSRSETMLLIPTRQEIAASVLGYRSGPCTPITWSVLSNQDRPKQNEFYMNKVYTDIKHRLRKWGTNPHKLSRKYACPHIKTYLRYNPNNPSELAWVLITSHNASKAAWGSFNQSKTSLYIRSYELGVLLVPRLVNRAKMVGYYSIISQTRGEKLNACDMPSNNTFSLLKTDFLKNKKNADFLIPIPYPLPPQPYENEDEIWCADIVHTDLDRWNQVYDRQNVLLTPPIICALRLETSI